MKKIIISFVLIVFSLFSVAQGIVFNKFQNRKNNDRSTAVIVGLKGGYSLYNMSFTDKDYDNLEGESINKPAYGIFVEIPVVKGLSVAPEFIMIERGMQKSYKWRDNIPTKDSIAAKYVDIRIPVIYRFLRTGNVNPYVYGAVDFGYVYGGKASRSYSKTESVDPGDYGLANQSLDIPNTSVMSRFAFSALAGVGVRFNINFKTFSLIAKIDAGYNFGFTDTYSEAEHDGSVEPININVYSSDRIKKRYNRGFEAMISIGLPLKFADKDACAGF